MKKTNLLLWLGVPAAAGAALGILADRRHPVKGSILGAVAGVLTGSAAAGIYNYVQIEDKVPYYSKSSPLYDDLPSL